MDLDVEEEFIKEFIYIFDKSTTPVEYILTKYRKLAQRNTLVTLRCVFPILCCLIC